MSGYLEYNRGNEEFLEDGFFLQKPFSRDALVPTFFRRSSSRRCFCSQYSGPSSIASPESRPSRARSCSSSFACCSIAMRRSRYPSGEYRL